MHTLPIGSYVPGPGLIIFYSGGSENLRPWLKLAAFELLKRKLELDWIKEFEVRQTKIKLTCR